MRVIIDGVDRTNGDPTSELQRSAFNEVLTAELTPVVNMQMPYNVNADLMTTTLTGSGEVTHTNNLARVNTTAVINSSAKIETKQALQYKAGTGALIRMAGIFTTGVVGSEQIFGPQNVNDALAFGYDGVDFGILHRNATVDTWIPQSTWNIDKFDGTGKSGVLLDPTTGNVYQIRYQWLGFGMLSFFIENGNTGLFTLVHQIAYANLNTALSLSNPTLPLAASVENTTNDTAISIQMSSMAAYIEGEINTANSVINSTSNSKSIGTTETNVFTIRNKVTYQSITNAVRVKPVLVTVQNDANVQGEFRVLLNTTLGGTPAFADISTNTSVVEVDTAGTTITGGKEILAFELARQSSDKQDFNIFGEPGFVLHPGDALTITAVLSAGAAVLSASLVWQELF